MENVNYEEKLTLMKKVNAKLDKVFGKEAVLGHSLNNDNLKGILHKVLLAS